MKLQEGNAFSCVCLSTGVPCGKYAWRIGPDHIYIPPALVPAPSQPHYPSIHEKPCCQTCSNLYNLHLTVQGPPNTSPDFSLWSKQLVSYCNAFLCWLKCLIMKFISKILSNYLVVISNVTYILFCCFKKSVYLLLLRNQNEGLLDSAVFGSCWSDVRPSSVPRWRGQ